MKQKPIIQRIYPRGKEILPEIVVQNRLYCLAKACISDDEDLSVLATYKPKYEGTFNVAR